MQRYTIRELVEVSGFPERSIRHYVLQGFLPRAAYHGKDTLYDEAHRIGLAAILKLQTEHRVYRLEALGKWFEGKSLAEIEAFVTGAPWPPPKQSEQILPPPRAPEPPPLPPPPPPPREEPVEVAAPKGERWVHVSLVPGMQLLVRDDAPPLVARLAEEIRAKYATG